MTNQIDKNLLLHWLDEQIAAGAKLKSMYENMRDKSDLLQLVISERGVYQKIRSKVESGYFDHYSRTIDDCPAMTPLVEVMMRKLEETYSEREKQ